MGDKDLVETRRSVLRHASGTVLEIGSGPGYNFPLYGAISKLYALEPSPELSALAAKHRGATSFPIEFIQSGAEHIPLPDQSVDTVVSTWTLCSVTSPDLVLHEIRRVLRPGGTFLFVEHGASPNTFLHILQSVLTRITKYFTGNCHYDRDIEKLLSTAGFTMQATSHPPEPSRPLIYNTQGSASVTASE